MNLSFHPDARIDLLEAQDYYRTKNEKVALAFTDQVSWGIEQIVLSPDRWKIHEHGTRRFLLSRFPHAIIYRDIASTTNMNKDARLADYLEHIVIAIDKIAKYTVEGKEKFFESELIQDAVMRNLEIVGEASSIIKRDYSDVVVENPEIPFRSATEMRNVQSHEYFNVDAEILWNTITNDLGMLKSQIQGLQNRTQGTP